MKITFELWETQFVRKLFMMMMALVFLFIIELQATDLTSTSFYPASVSIPLPHDHVYHSLPDCIDNEVNGCKQQQENLNSVRLGMCLIQSFRNCMKNPLYQNDPHYEHIKYMRVKCDKIHQKSVQSNPASHHQLGYCLLSVYQRKYKKKFELF